MALGPGRPFISVSKVSYGSSVDPKSIHQKGFLHQAPGEVEKNAAPDT